MNKMLIMKMMVIENPGVATAFKNHSKRYKSIATAKAKKQKVRVRVRVRLLTPVMDMDTTDMIMDTLDHQTDIMMAIVLNPIRSSRITITLILNLKE